MYIAELSSTSFYDKIYSRICAISSKKDVKKR